MKRGKEKTVLKKLENEKSGNKGSVYLRNYSIIINFILVCVTALMACFTYGLFKTSSKSLKQQFEALQEQSNYYKVTTRPFVNIADNDSVRWWIPGEEPGLNYFIRLSSLISILLDMA